jgi:hypothetical protein
MKKKLIIILFLCWATNSVAQTAMVDTSFPGFKIIFDTTVDVISYSVPKKDINYLFGSDSLKIDKTNDDIYFVLAQRYYKVYFDKTMYYIQAKYKKDIAEHFLKFINQIRIYNQKQ